MDLTQDFYVSNKSKPVAGYNNIIPHAPFFTPSPLLYPIPFPPIGRTARPVNDRGNSKTN